MSMLQTCKQIACHQASNLVRAASGTPLTPVPLASMTLDIDDVELAHRWILDRSHWDDIRPINDFESAFAEWNGSRSAFSFLGGRVALSAAIYALGLQPGDEVVLPGYTCVVVPNAFHFAGVKVVYCDIELDTWGIDVASMEARLTPRTRAVLIQHLYGLVCRDYESILHLSQRRGLRVIEDCAHATGAIYRGTKVGNRGDIGFYSSEQSKVFNTTQGGVAVTNDPRLAERLAEYQRRAPLPDADRTERLLYTLILNYHQNKDSQSWWRGDWTNLRYGDKRLISTTLEEEQGIRPAHYGARMPAPIAALGLNQLQKIDQYNELRRQTARRWAQWCDDNGYRQPAVIEGSKPVYVRYPVLVEPERKANPTWANALGVELGVWFVSQIHPVATPVTNCPAAAEAVARSINFPTIYL
ncbi:MAG: DegT/DnrJ/EryC1/StrS family aminotransferase [Terriglobales bacterium]